MWKFHPPIVLVVFATIICAFSKTYAQESLCRVQNGLSSVIIDIQESIENQLDQSTTPKELPIIGDPQSQISLTLVYPNDSMRYFRLEGKRLQLTQPLDRDKDDISSIVFQIMCSVKSTREKRTIPVIVRVSDRNDNAPKFIGEPYEVSIPESASVGTTVFRGIRAQDIDSGVNGLIEFFVIDSEEEKNEENGMEFFSIKYPHQGIVTLNRTLDFERSQRYYVTILASDRAYDPRTRRTSTTTLTVNVMDSDDQGPAFIQKNCVSHEEYCLNAEYRASVTRGVLSGILDILPENIVAVDKDSLNNPIQYSFVTGSPPSYVDYFHIDPQTGIARQIRKIENDDETRFDIIIKALEVSESKKFASAKLTILVKPMDQHPPVIHTTSLIGYVEENSPVGIAVLSTVDNQPIRLSVSDADLAANNPKVEYKFDLTTSAFSVNEENVLIVAQEHLDRDPPHPSELRFQIIAREIGTGDLASSSPLILVVRLLDKNDNAPVLTHMSPITIPGGDGRRPVRKIEAEDLDEGLFGKIFYSFHHISNNGKDKFLINKLNGLIEAVGMLHSGEQYSLTIQATDGGGRSSQGILEVNVANGPNLKAPIFTQHAYDVEVSEGASIGAEVITLEAKDPEGQGSVIYSIVGGNELKHFTIGKNTGTLIVNGQLDREDLSRYSLVVKAEDEGSLFSVTNVNVKILDLNDSNPKFTNSSYKFRVKEGQKPGTILGNVEAIDADEKENGNGIIIYETPAETPFSVNLNSGQISTKIQLDYETQKIYEFIVTAKDLGGKESQQQQQRISTATVTIEVDDSDDEPPVFTRFTYEVTVEENFSNMKIARVVAHDPDTTKHVTYFIKQGPYDKFGIDPITGEIYTTHGLDYEENKQIILIVGTEENDSSNIGSTTTVIINILDTNDMPPTFNIVPRPIRLEDTAHIGMVVTKLQATDGDASSPNNKVKYEMVGRGKSSRFFDVDHDTGVVFIKDDLRKELSNEYQLDIRAYDLGDPQLESVASVKVYIDHVATVPPDVGVGFADIDYTVELPESSLAGQIIKVLTVVNKPSESVPIGCEIVSANMNDLFDVKVTKDKNCVLSLAQGKLDYEMMSAYTLQIKLTTLPGIMSKKRSISTVTVKIIDENDNKPEFIFGQMQNAISGKKLYAAIPDGAQIATIITQIQASDKDSGKLGEITYALDSENSLANSYFTINFKTGILSNTKAIESIPSALLPIRLIVLAKDNPHGISQIAQVPLIINVIDEPHRMVLVIEGSTPERVKIRESDIIELLQEMSGLVIGIEKITSHRFILPNGSMDSDSTATDVWFYAVDPINDFILDRESIKVTDKLMSHQGFRNISYFISSKFNLRPKEIRRPLSRAPLPPAPVGPLEREQQWIAFPAGLIALACLIFIVGVSGTCFICYKWSKYTAYKNQEQRIIVSPRYEPMYTEHSPDLKQYETQVLQMRVNSDEADLEGSDLHVDFSSSRNHIYSGENSSRVSRVGSRAADSGTYFHNPPITTPILRTFQQSIATIDRDDPSISNPIYERSEDDEDAVVSITSETNENVHFQQPRDFCATRHIRRTDL